MFINVLSPSHLYESKKNITLQTSQLASNIRSNKNVIHNEDFDYLSEMLDRTNKNEFSSPIYNGVVKNSLEELKKVIPKADPI